MRWLKARFESILDNLIFAGIVAGGVAVWTAIKSLPPPIIIGIPTAIFIGILVAIRIILSFIRRRQGKNTKQVRNSYKRNKRYNR